MLLHMKLITIDQLYAALYWACGRSDDPAEGTFAVEAQLVKELIRALDWVPPLKGREVQTRADVERMLRDL